VGLIGNGEGHTLIILTGAESMLLRDWLSAAPGQTMSDKHREAALAAFNRGIKRGTERVQAEFAAIQAEKKAGRK
jgi:hypothetical protein